jgi:creatinine amidohydrolase/Fe(II)-dependent formamide hydrolase-like protein
MRKFLIAEMTPAEITASLKETDTVVIPIGTVEQHGPHLPVSTDTFIPIRVAELVAEKTNVLVAPPVFYGDSLSMMSMAGVFTITPETLASLLLDLCKSFSKQGFKRIVFINGHGGNTQVLSFVGQRARIETGAQIVRINWWIIASEEITRICESGVVHADEGETSMMLACRPDLVDMNKAVKDSLQEKLTQELTGKKPGNMPQIYAPFPTWSKTGVIGDATKASKEKGEKILKAVVNNIVDFLSRMDRLQ